MTAGVVLAVAGAAVCAVSLALAVWVLRGRLRGTSAGVAVSASCVVLSVLGAVTAAAGAALTFHRLGFTIP